MLIALFGNAVCGLDKVSSNPSNGPPQLIMMNISVLLAYLAAVLTAGLAVYVVSRDQKNVVSRFFAAGMALLVIEAVVSAMALRSADPEEFLLWYR
ncbi:MAG TPA: hypothetical protein PKM95_11175, partial [Deltaproteobacteria bacterium]|nr:hypothetical protein [Deltaproteobacteria bacterium]